MRLRFFVVVAVVVVVVMVVGVVVVWMHMSIINQSCLFSIGRNWQKIEFWQI